MSRHGEGESGMCVECKEWTDVGSSCCGRGVHFEGGFVADYEDEEPDDKASAAEKRIDGADLARDMKRDGGA